MLIQEEQQEENKDQEDIKFLSESMINKQLQCPKQNQECQTCKLKKAKYSCPKCNSPYCSLQCYKNHSLDCVTKFTEEQEKEKYKGIKADFDTQIETKKLLNKIYREREEEPMELYIQEQQEKRYEELIKSDVKDINQLTLVEQKQFSDYILGNNQELETWLPWWDIKEGMFSLYIEEISDIKKNSSDYLEDNNHYKEQINQCIEYRKLLRNKIHTIVPFDKLAKGSQPNEDIQNHLVNIVISIAILYRAYNGDTNSLCQEAVGNLNNICRCFKIKQNIFGSILNSFNALFEDATRIDKDLFQGFYQLIFEDSIKIFSNKFSVIESLFMCYDLLHACYEQSRAEKQKGNVSQLATNFKQYYRELDLIKNKIIYFISYVMQKDHLFFQQLKEKIYIAEKQHSNFKKQTQDIEEFKQSNLIV